MTNNSTYTRRYCSRHTADNFPCDESHLGPWMASAGCAVGISVHDNTRNRVINAQRSGRSSQKTGQETFRWSEVRVINHVGSGIRQASRTTVQIFNFGECSAMKSWTMNRELYFYFKYGRVKSIGRSVVDVDVFIEASSRYSRSLIAKTFSTPLSKPLMFPNEGKMLPFFWGCIFKPQNFSSEVASHRYLCFLHPRLCHPRKNVQFPGNPQHANQANPQNHTIW